MSKVELIYDADCPNVDDARANLRRAFDELGIGGQWQEWDRADPAAPDYVRGYGSPTVLVDGRDVAGHVAGDSVRGCRVYGTASGRRAGVPPVEMIVGALRGAAGSAPAVGTASGWRSSLAVLPAAGAFLLPAATCPACWPAYAALLSAVGLGFVPTSKYMLPLMALLLVAALLSLAFRARRRRAYGPLLLGLVGAAALLGGKFVEVLSLGVYPGVLLLIGASVWNGWPRGVSVVTGRSCCAGANNSSFSRQCPRRKEV